MNYYVISVIIFQIIGVAIMINLVFVGLGKQNSKDHIKAALANKKVKIIAVCDTDKAVAKATAEKLKVPFFLTVESLLKNTKPDAAVVAVPHKYYTSIVSEFLTNGVHVLKEKPLNIDFKSALHISNLAAKHKVNLTVAVQRKHNKIYNLFSEYKEHIGEVFSVHGEYTLNIADLSEGWRSSKDLAGGGAVIDMGYHLLDLIVWYFGVPEKISAELGYNNKKYQKYDVEDTAKIQFSYAAGARRIVGSMLLSRIYPSKDEGLFIYGTRGAVKIFKDKIELYDNNREMIESNYIKSNGDDIRLQLDSFVDKILSGDFEGNHKDHLRDMIFIDAIYTSDKNNTTVLPYEESRYKEILNSGKKRKGLN